jgi:cytochrome c oxidase cbb3-type subunit 3
MKDGKIDEHTGTETTGHEWDGIQELNTPLPRWWLGIFYACILWAVGYWVVYPAWPGISSYTHGLWNHSLRDAVTADVGALKAARAAKETALRDASLAQIQSDPDLQQFAMAEGRALFGDNCAPCHGAGGQGAHGYPNLNDDVWLWGGTLADIQHTISVGVRSTSPDTRNSQMPAFGRDGMLKEAQVDDLTEYVVRLSGRAADAAAVKRAAPLFTQNCAMCHGNEGKGNREMGAPNLTDNESLYGSGHEESRAEIQDQIWNGHGGVMPTWNGRLTAEEIKSLAVYVHSLGGGE